LRSRHDGKHPTYRLTASWKFPYSVPMSKGALMPQNSPSRMTRFRLFWEAADAVLARRGLPPLTFEAARDWFECELEPEAVGDLLEAHAPVANEASQ
jgi:hypothetical protein